RSLGMSFLGSARTAPLPPLRSQVVNALSARTGSCLQSLQQSLADTLKVMQEGPTTRKTNEDAALADDNFGRDFDEQQTPGCRLTSAERVVFATAIKVTTSCWFWQGFGWKSGFRDGQLRGTQDLQGRRCRWRLR